MCSAKFLFMIGVCVPAQLEYARSVCGAKQTGASLTLQGPAMCCITLPCGIVCLHVAPLNTLLKGATDYAKCRAAVPQLPNKPACLQAR